MIPEWANNVLINKGLGFESVEFKTFVYGYFAEQFEGMNLPISELKKRTIDKAIRPIKQQPRPVVEARPVQPVKQSALAEKKNIETIFDTCFFKTHIYGNFV